MRTAVISDIHGNNIALNAVLDDIDAQSIDQIVCLGDVAQGGPQPVEVLDKLRELQCPVVIGNADAWMVTGVDTGQEGQVTPVKEDVRQWSRAQLSQDDIDFINSFKPTIPLDVGGGRQLLCFHGSPHSFDDIIFPDMPEPDFDKMFNAFKGSILTGGHTHLQQIRRYGDTFFFNPGSIGFSYSHHQTDDFRADHWAEYGILAIENGRSSLELRRIPFEVDELIQVYRASGRPHSDEAIHQYRKG